MSGSEIAEAVLRTAAHCVFAWLAIRAGLHNLLLWRRSDKRGPLIEATQVARVEPYWPVEKARARQWPPPTEEARALHEPAYWAAYARLAQEEAQRKRLFAQGGLVFAGSWLGFRIEPLVRDSWRPFEKGPRVGTPPSISWAGTSAFSTSRHSS